MKIINELLGINEVGQFNSEVLYLTTDAIVIESLNLSIQYDYNKGDCIRFYEVIENELLVYVGCEYNSSYKVIDSKGDIKAERKLTFIGKVGSVILESDSNHNIHVSEYRNNILEFRKTVLYSQVKYFDSDHFILCQFGDSTSIDIYSFSTMGICAHLNLLAETDFKSDKNRSDFYLKKIIGISGSYLIFIINSGQLMIYDFNNGGLCKLVTQENELEINSESVPQWSTSMKLALNIDHKNNLLYGLNGKWYYECDLTSEPFACQTWSIQSELVINGVEWIDKSVRCHPSDNCLMFLVNRITNNPNNVGIFNRDKRKVVEKYSVGPNSNNSDNMFTYDHPPARMFISFNNSTYIHFNTKNRPLFMLKHENEKGNLS